MAGSAKLQNKYINRYGQKTGGLLLRLIYESGV